MSKYTAHQIYALAQFILANANRFSSQYHPLAQSIRHLEYNAQRNLPDDSEKYFVKYLHTTVDKAMEEASKVQFQLTQPAKASHAAPTTKPPEPPKRRTAVFVSCAACGSDVAVPEDKAEAPAFCNQACRDKATKTYQTNLQSLVSESDKFLTEVGSRYYNCEYNTQKLVNYLTGLKRKITAENLFDAFLDLQPQLLKSLTLEEILAMKPEEFEQRSKLEGSDKTGIMGGIELASIGKKRGETMIHSSNKIRTYEQSPRGTSSIAGRV